MNKLITTILTLAILSTSASALTINITNNAGDANITLKPDSDAGGDYEAVDINITSGEMKQVTFNYAPTVTITATPTETLTATPTPTPTPTPPIITDSKLPVLTPGKHWVMTFEDNFNGTTIDRSKWFGGYANQLWCNKGNCPEQWTGISLNNGILAMHGTIDYKNFNNSLKYENRAIMNTGGLTLDTAKFSQRYGYFEASMKYPVTTNGAARGAWFSFWTLPMLKTSNSGVPRSQLAEIDIQEIVSSSSTAHVSQTNIHDNNRSNAKRYSVKTTDDLSEDFHRYGLYWWDDGTPHGSVQPYFDGTPQGEPYTLVNTLFDNGIFIILQHISCYRYQDFISGTSCTQDSVSNNPVFYDFVRVYKEVPD